MKKRLRVVGCIVKCGDEILLLYRSKNETDPSLWGIPAGKVEMGETDVQAVIREVREETAIELVESKLKYLGLIPIEYDSFIVDFPIFFTEFDKKPDLSLSPSEHIDFQWIKPIDILEIPDIMKGVDVIVKDFCIDKLKINNPE